LLDALWGLVVMAAAAVTPFARPARNRWGMGEAADRRYPGDGLIEAPRWQWTHGVEIEAPPTAVWPWVAQVGVDRGGFYSYAALENLVGCGVRNAEEVRPAWAHRPGDRLVLHPKLPALEVVGVVPGRWLLAHGEPPPGARARGDPWVAVTWLLLVEDLGAGRSRFVSRYRCATSDDLATRLRFGPTLVEPVAFAMDRRMLLGVKARAERHPPPAAPPGRAPSVEPGSVRPRAGGDGRPARTAARQHHGGGATAAPRRRPRAAPGRPGPGGGGPGPAAAGGGAGPRAGSPTAAVPPLPPGGCRARSGRRGGRWPGRRSIPSASTRRWPMPCCRRRRPAGCGTRSSPARRCGAPPCWRCRARSASGGGCRSPPRRCWPRRTASCGRRRPAGARSGSGASTATPTARATCAGRCSAWCR